MDNLKHKRRKLKTIFLRTSLYAMLGISCIALSCFVFYLVSMLLHILIPAHLSVEERASWKNTILRSEANVDMFQNIGERYAFWDHDGTWLGGDISREDALRIYNENIEYGYHDINDIESECLVIEADSKIVIIDFGYPTAHRFANKYLNKRFSYPEAMYIYIFAMTSIVFLLLYLRKSGRTLSIEVEKMLTVTKQVENHNLDFEVPSSCYAEVDKVLSSMDQMRAALVDSLKAQWDIEEERIKQIAELAHDIKTPLTVIRGNAELLQDCGLSQKQNLYNSYILKSAAILESYLMKLREYIHKIDIILDYTVVNLDSFWQELVGLLKSMSQSTKLQVLQSMDYHYAQIHIDPNAVKRAFLNMFENAVLYSAEDDCLSFMLEVNENECRFILENKVSASRIHTPMKIDSMIGWKDSMLAGHGLGVSIAKSIVESHGGKLLYEIDENRGSGVVEIKLPLYKTNASSDVNL